MQNWFAEYEVKNRGVVGLYDEEEDLLCGNTKESWADDGVGGIGPYLLANEV